MTRMSQSPRAEINPTSALQAQLKIRPEGPENSSSRPSVLQDAPSRGKRPETGKPESKMEVEELPVTRKAEVWDEGGARQHQEERAEGKLERGEKQGAGREETALDHCHPHPH